MVRRRPHSSLSMHGIAGVMALQAKPKPHPHPQFMPGPGRGVNQALPPGITPDVGSRTACLRFTISTATQTRVKNGRCLSFLKTFLLPLVVCLLFSVSFPLPAQNTSSAPASVSNPASTPTEMFSSYEGQNVSSIQVAGRPDLDPSLFASSFA